MAAECVMFLSRLPTHPVHRLQPTHTGALSCECHTHSYIHHINSEEMVDCCACTLGVTTVTPQQTAREQE